MIRLLVNACASGEQHHLLCDLFADVALSQEAHDTLINTAQVFLDNFEFSVLNQGNVRDWVAFFENVLPGMLVAGQLEEVGQLQDGLVREAAQKVLLLEVLNDGLLLLLVEALQIPLVIVFGDRQEETAFGGQN